MDMISERVKKIELSGIRKYFEMASEDTINLGIGQPDFQPPEGAIEAYHEAMKKGHNGYGSTYGLLELREEIAREYSKYEDGLSKDNVLIHVGATQAFKIITESFIEEGDEVLYPEPGFVLYDSQVELAGGEPVPYPVEQRYDFIPQIEHLEERKSPNTKAIIVNSPSNPTGGVIPEKDIEKICDWAEENDVIVFSDEVYEKMVYGKRHDSFLGNCDNVIMINSFSKTFAMTGWRVGFIIGSEEWIEELGKVNYYNVAAPPTPTQYAVLHALKHEEKFLNEMTATFRQRRDVIVERLNEIDGIECLKPEGAFYVFPSFDLDVSSEELVNKLLDEGVLATPGTAFGSTGEGHIRFSYANSTEQIEKAMAIVSDVVKELR